MSGRCIHVLCTNSEQARNLVWQNKETSIWVVMRQYLNSHSAFEEAGAHRLTRFILKCRVALPWPRKAGGTIFYLLVLYALKNLDCVCSFLGEIREEIGYYTNGYRDKLFLLLFVNVTFSHALMTYLIAKHRGIGRVSHSWISIHSPFVLSLPWKLQVYLTLGLT